MSNKWGKLCLLWACGALIAILALTMPAGTGRMVSATPSYLVMNLYYNYAPTNLDVMRPAFEEASRLLYNSTNGQLYIGTVRVSVNTAFQNKADVWVNSGASGAFSGIAGMGTPGIHFTLFENRHRWTAEDGPDGDERGQFGIIHEFGHYGFNLYDEYFGSGGSANCVSSTDTVACIMDGGTQVHPNHHRTEWCTPSGGGLTTAHVTSPATRQEEIHGESCWETIVDYCSSEYGITFTAPASVQTGDPAGLPSLNWVGIGDNLRLVIALDRSGSMSVSDKMTLAKQAAILFVDLCENDTSEYLGVVSFSNTAVSDFSIQNVTTAASIKDNAVAAINGIAIENMTALGDGLRCSLNEITGGGTVSSSDAAVEAIVLLSDGVHNYGTESPAAVLPDLRDRGVQVFSIGLGNPADPVYPLDEATLLDISNQTGGMYTHATAADQLATIYADYAAEIRGMDSYPEASAELSREASREHRVFVDKFTKEQTFILHWPYGARVFELQLRKPDGTVLTPTTPGLKYVSRPNHGFYRISGPESGTWTLVVKANPKSKWERNTYRYTVQSMAKAPGLTCLVEPRQKKHDPGKPLILRSAVYAMGVPVTNVDIRGMVVLPNGKRVRIRFVDDGNMKRSGDDIAHDGIYSARFIDTRLAGTYKVSVIIRNREGMAAKPDEYDPKWKPFRIDPFTRKASTEFQVGRIAVKPPQSEKR